MIMTMLVYQKLKLTGKCVDKVQHACCKDVASSGVTPSLLCTASGDGRVEHAWQCIVQAQHRRAVTRHGHVH